MTPRRLARPLGALLALLLIGAATTGCKPADGAGSSAAPSRSASATAGRTDLPSSMVALGDSLTSGFGSCLALTSCPRNSWATGDGLLVDSHYRRILAGNPAIKGKARNLSVAGATSADLPGQARSAVSAAPDYVTILIGANDACRPDIAAMTAVETFRSRVGSALSTLKASLPRTRILIASIPDVYRVWQVAHTNSMAQRVWGLGVCPSLLANPTSTAAADTERRQAFQDRVDAYDRALAAACTAYGPRCRYDGGAVHRVEFDPKLLSPLDFFHPNLSGQTELANVTYPGTFTW